jgi:hypothetical protein
VTAAAPSLGQRLARSLRLVERLQHPSGEILSYHRDAQGNYVYCRSPLLSTFVHEALDCFDPTSAHWSDGALEILPADARAGSLGRCRADYITGEVLQVTGGFGL